MDGKVKACTACTRMCWMVHSEKKNSSPAVSSFFKIMFGDEFSTALIFPPKFAHEVSLFVGQRTILEDSSGEQWEVTISKVNGSLAFEQGWGSFALDHDLEVGDFVVFFHMAESHFVVKIYDKTSCEKLNFPERSNQKKRMRDDRSFTGKDEPFCAVDAKLTNKHGLGTSVMSGVTAKNGGLLNEMNDVVKVPTVSQNIAIGDKTNEISGAVSKGEYVDDTYFMINRDPVEKQDENGRCYFDLSVFEMWNNTGSKRNNTESLTDERVPYQVDSSLRSQNGACLIDKDKVAIEVSSGVEPLNSFNCEKNESSSDKGSCIVMTSGNLLLPSVVNPKENGENTSNMSNRGTKECQVAEGNNQVSQFQKHNANKDNCQSAKRSFKGTSAASNISTDIGTKNYQSGKMMKFVKEEPMDIESDPCSHGTIQKHSGESSKVTNVVLSRSVSLGVRKDDRGRPVVKTENVDLVGGSSTDPPNTSSFLATSSKSFIELPESLPFPVVKGRSDVERKLVLLQDPARRLWPVLYHEKLNLKVIRAGWEALCKANGIQSGDQCLFKMANESEGIYSVTVIRK